MPQLIFITFKTVFKKKLLAQRNNKITRLILLALRKSILIFHLQRAQRKCHVI